MLIRVHPDNPQEKLLLQVVDCLKDGGVIIYPTDTVYGIGCDVNKSRAVERVCRIKGIKPEKANFSMICADLSHLSDYARQVPTSVYKLMRKALPGPYTFILEASSNVPKLFRHKKNTVGIRVPDNRICLEIIRMLGNPLMSSSVHDENDPVIDYMLDPELMHEKYMNEVDLVIDGGWGGMEASTIIDCSRGEVNVIREGKGILSDLF